MKKISKKTWRIIEIVGAVVFLIIFAINFKMVADIPGDSGASADAKGWAVIVFPALVFFEFSMVFALPLFAFLLIRGIVVRVKKMEEEKTPEVTPDDKKPAKKAVKESVSDIPTEPAPKYTSVFSGPDNPLKKVFSVLGCIFTWPKVLIFTIVTDSILVAIGVDQVVLDSVVTFQVYLILIMIVKLVVSGVRGK